MSPWLAGWLGSIPNASVPQRPTPLDPTRPRCAPGLPEVGRGERAPSTRAPCRHHVPAPPRRRRSGWALSAPTLPSPPPIGTPWLRDPPAPRVLARHPHRWGAAGDAAVLPTAAAPSPGSGSAASTRDRSRLPAGRRQRAREPAPRLRPRTAHCAARPSLSLASPAIGRLATSGRPHSAPVTGHARPEAGQCWACAGLVRPAAHQPHLFASSSCHWREGQRVEIPRAL